ncbi:MAG: heparinase II/III-family protein, partial [Acidobacteria bacterium]|nr:heparinase II/III-family protein [Acidobacteriota bacterium]
IGDDDGGRLHFLDGRSIDDFRSTLAVGAALLDDRHLKFAAGNPSPELLWLLGPKGLGDFESLDPVRPFDKVKAFAESGFYSIRDSWERNATFLLVDCGPHGFLNGGHAHADALSIVMSVNGVPIFVDSGTCSYTADIDARNYFRSTAAHNCLNVNGQSSSIPAGPFGWKATANAKRLEWKADGPEVVFRGTHDGFERFGVGYEREIRFSDSGETQTIDKIKTGTSNSFEVNFILSPGVIVTSHDGMSVLIRTKDGNRDLLRIDTKLTEERECTGWQIKAAKISPRYGSLVETTKLVLNVRSESDFEIVNNLIPVKN